jgi:hypothetical protein
VDVVPLGDLREPQAGYSLLSGPAAGMFASHTARALTEVGDYAGAEARHRAAFTSWDPAAFPRVHLLTWTAGQIASARSRAALASVRGPLTADRLPTARRARRGRCQRSCPEDKGRTRPPGNHLAYSCNGMHTSS